jgi:chorismate mutase
MSLTIQPLQDWGLNIKGTRLLISGPCSAETAEQVDQTLEGLSTSPVDVYRAGIWKPRTRPNSFEGVGSVGLKWLKDSAKKQGKPVTVEVANVKHVYEALKAGIDMLWIGARTSTNPFAVQEIADALKGVDIPVLVKNPINPDLSLWIGALERINQAGITKIGAIHRGFSSYSPTKYRNHPRWEIPIELRRLYPNLPIVCDPSHICGTRELIPAVSQKALDLGFDGLMIESHINPDVALSDAKQQLTPFAFEEMISGMIKRKPLGDDPTFIDKLENLRHSIDDLDNELVNILAKRMGLVREIGEYKKQNNVAILQAARWNEIVHERIEQALPLGMSEDFMITVLQAIHKESIRNQAQVMNTETQEAK